MIGIISWLFIHRNYKEMMAKKSGTRQTSNPILTTIILSFIIRLNLNLIRRLYKQPMPKKTFKLNLKDFFLMIFLINFSF